MDNARVESPSHPLKAFASRVGHDAVWIAIAGLFCVVEGAAKLTEFTPAKLIRLWQARQRRTSGHSRAGLLVN